MWGRRRKIRQHDGQSIRGNSNGTYTGSENGTWSATVNDGGVISANGPDKQVSTVMGTCITCRMCHGASDSGHIVEQYIGSGGENHGRASVSFLQ
jgi:hypothetical protein